MRTPRFFLFFFFNDTATTEIYTLSLHDALPISRRADVSLGGGRGKGERGMNDPIRVGVIGAGAIAQVAHLPALRRMAGVEVVAICDNDIAKARALAGRFEVRDSYDDIEDVLRYASADAVVICTPNHLHEIHAMAALAAGAHVLCERPLALTAPGVERLLQASEKHGKRVMVGMNHRFRSDVQAVRGFLAGGDIGPLQAGPPGLVTLPPPRPPGRGGAGPAEGGGGAVLSLRGRPRPPRAWAPPA